MTFIIDKTVFIHFANRHVLPSPFYLTFDESVISDKCEVKDLGLKVSNNLKWKLYLNCKIENSHGISPLSSELFLSVLQCTLKFDLSYHVCYPPCVTVLEYGSRIKPNWRA